MRSLPPTVVLILGLALAGGRSVFAAGEPAQTVVSPLSLVEHRLGDNVAAVLQWEGEAALMVRRGGRIVHKVALFSERGQTGWSLGTVLWSPDGSRLAFQLRGVSSAQALEDPVRILVPDGDGMRTWDAKDLIRRSNPDIGEFSVTSALRDSIAWNGPDQLVVRVLSKHKAHLPRRWLIDLVRLEAKPVAEDNPAPAPEEGGGG